MIITRRQFTKAGLLTSGAFLALPLQGCGENSTLARYAPAIVPLADILETALGQMRDAGAIKQADYDKLMAIDPRTGLNLIGGIKAVGVYLVGVSVVTAGNKPEILAKVKEGIDLVGRVVPALAPGSKGARVLASIKIGFDAILLGVTILNPPAVSVAASTGQVSGIPASKVAVRGVKLDADIERELKAKMKK